MVDRRRWSLFLIIIVLLAGCGNPDGTAVVALSAVEPTGVATTPGQRTPTAGRTGTQTVVLVATPTGTLAVPITATAGRSETNGTWASAGTLNKMRLAHSATLLADGRVLVVGGSTNLGATGGALNKAEIYDPATNSWAETGDLSLARSNHTATVLPDGRVVVLGGRVPGGNGQGWQSSADAEAFDGSTTSWQSLAAAPTTRSQHAAVLLPNGTILVIGGLTGDQGSGQSTAATEVYDPATNIWTAVGSLTKSRHGHTATLLADGRVLVTGGESRGANGATELTASAEIYDPESRAWTTTGPLTTGRQAHTATLLPDGRVLVIGGESSLTRGGDLTFVAAFPAALAPVASAEIYDPRARTWQATANLPDQRAAHTATMLPGGQVLVVGGYGPNDRPTSTALRYDPVGNRWTPFNAPTPRAEHTATLLLDGSVIVSGGRNIDGVTASAERYFPQGQLPATPAPSPSPEMTATAEPSPSIAPVVPGATQLPTNTPTRTRTPTPVPPTASPTRTPTQAPVAPTTTPAPPTATATATARPTNTPAPIPPTPTNTPVPPTATSTPVPPTATNTPTRTPIPPTATNTPTNTPVPPTPTYTPTRTPVPPTATNTRVPPTATNTPIPPGTLSGTIFFCPNRACEPVSGATVSVGGRTATSNANGAYTISNLPAGSYTVTASYRTYSGTASATVVGGKTTVANVSIYCCAVN